MGKNIELKEQFLDDEMFNSINDFLKTYKINLTEIINNKDLMDELIEEAGKHFSKEKVKKFKETLYNINNSLPNNQYSSCNNIIYNNCDQDEDNQSNLIYLLFVLLIIVAIAGYRK